ncbi:MAG: LlaJI family restriction endonuclease [Coriobacteriaceae bacterium]|nr:LlaJI family restriction endonuclease [Coriobacteriaceae bacterium]
MHVHRHALAHAVVFGTVRGVASPPFALTARGLACVNLRVGAALKLLEARSGHRARERPSRGRVPQPWGAPHPSVCPIGYRPDLGLYECNIGRCRLPRSARDGKSRTLPDSDIGSGRIPGRTPCNAEASSEDFGDADFITYRLECERTVQFVTWKQDVIDLLLRYVGEDDSTVRQDTPLCLGTSSFYHVWEEACKVAFDDALGKRLTELGVELAAPFDAIGGTKLIDVIPRPQWTVPAGNGEEGCGDVATLIPDTVLLHHDRAGNSVFAILDAKYYTPELGANVSGIPGVESVTKQFLYQNAYRKFVLAHEYGHVVNAFLAPSAGDAIEHTGRVRFPGVIADEEPPFSNVVELYALPADMVFDAYLAGAMLDNAELLAVLG